MIDHLLVFTSEAAAKTDPVVGKYFIPADATTGFLGGWRGDVCAPGLHVIGPSVLSFYIYIAVAGDTALDASPNLLPLATASAAFPLFMGRDFTAVKASVSAVKAGA